MFIPTVVIPAEIGVTVIGSVKFTVPAVPTVEPSSLTTIPEPDATTPVNPEPLPTNEPLNVVAFTVVAVTTPAMLTLSKLVCPSTSKSFTMLTTPLIVVIPATMPANCEPSPVYEVAATVPVTVIPDVVVSNLSVLFHLRTAAPPFENVISYSQQRF